MKLNRRCRLWSSIDTDIVFSQTVNADSTNIEKSISMYIPETMGNWIPWKSVVVFSQIRIDFFSYNMFVVNQMCMTIKSFLWNWVKKMVKLLFVILGNIRLAHKFCTFLTLLRNTFGFLFSCRVMNQTICLWKENIFLTIFTLLRIHPLLEAIHLCVDIFLLYLCSTTWSKVD